MAKEPTVSLGPLVFALAALLAAGPSFGVEGPPGVAAPTQREIRATRLAIITGSESEAPELKAAEMLENRILKRSSETGVESPHGWHSVEHAQCQWLVGDAHLGEKAVQAVSAKARSAWVTESFAIDAANPHIVDGWLRTASGEAWLEVRCFDADGRVLSRLKSPRAKAANRWAYVARRSPPS